MFGKLFNGSSKNSINSIKKCKDGHYRMTYDQAWSHYMLDPEFHAYFASDKERHYYASWLMVINNYDYTAFDKSTFRRFSDAARKGWFFGIDDHRYHRNKTTAATYGGDRWAFMEIPEFIPPALKGLELEEYNRLRAPDPKGERWYERYMFGLKRWPIEIIQNHKYMEAERKNLGLEELSSNPIDTGQRTFTSL